MYSLEIKKPGSGIFTFKNLEGHEPCHDFSPSGCGKRLARLNYQFQNILDKFTPSSGTASSGGMKGGALTRAQAKEAKRQNAEKIYAVDSLIDQIKTAKPEQLDDMRRSLKRILSDPTYRGLYTDSEIETMIERYTLNDDDYLTNSFLYFQDDDIALLTVNVVQTQGKEIAGLESMLTKPDYDRSLVEQIAQEWAAYIETLPSSLNSLIKELNLSDVPSDDGSELVQQFQTIASTVDYILLLCNSHMLNDTPQMGGSLDTNPVSSVLNLKGQDSAVDTVSSIPSQEIMNAKQQEPQLEQDPDLEQREKTGRKLGKGPQIKSGIDFFQQYVFANKIFDYLGTTWTNNYLSELNEIHDDIGVYELDKSISESEQLTAALIFDQVKALFNYYIENIDGTLPALVVINDEFMKDGLFLCILSLLSANRKKSDVNFISPAAIYSIRYPLPLTISKPQSRDPQQGGYVQHGGASLFSKLQSDVQGLALPDYQELKPVSRQAVVDVAGVYGPTLPATLTPEEMASWAQSTYRALNTEIVEGAGSGAANRIQPWQMAPIEDALIVYFDEAAENAIQAISADVAPFIGTGDNEISQATFDSVIAAMRRRTMKKHKTEFSRRAKTLLDRPGGAGKTFPQQLDDLILKSVHELELSLNGARADLIAVTVPQEGASKAAMSEPFKTATNQLLVALCSRLNDMFPPGAPTGNNVYDEENIIIDGVARGGSMSSIDKDLFDAWRSGSAPDDYWPNKVNGTRLDILGLSNELKRDQDAPGTAAVSGGKAVLLVNNAMNQDLIKLLLADPTIAILCHIASVMDAMGTIGSCYNGSSSPNFVNGNISITLSTDDETEFNVTQTVSNKKIVINYYLQSPISSQPLSIGQQLTHYENIVEILTNKAVMTLSAANTISGVLNRIMTHAISGVYKDVGDILKNNDFLNKAASAISKKYMGDFNQELGVCTQNGGFSQGASIGTGSKVYLGGGKQYGGGILEPSVALANGDRPSTVRSSCLLEGCVGDVNKNAQILYTTLFKKSDNTSDVYLTSKYNYATKSPLYPAVMGGGQSKKRKKILAPKMTLRKKRRQKKHKTRGHKPKPKIKSKINRKKTVSKKHRSRKNNKRR